MQTVGLLVWLTLASVVLSLLAIVGTSAGRVLLRTIAHRVSCRGFVRWILFTGWTVLRIRGWLLRCDPSGRRARLVIVGLTATLSSMMLVAGRWHRMNMWLEGEPS